MLGDLADECLAARLKYRKMHIHFADSSVSVQSRVAGSRPSADSVHPLQRLRRRARRSIYGVRECTTDVASSLGSYTVRAP
jgi:hypothetical protein